MTVLKIVKNNKKRFKKLRKKDRKKKLLIYKILISAGFI